MKVNTFKLRPIEKGDITQHILYFTFIRKKRGTTDIISLSSPGKAYSSGLTLIPTIVFSRTSAGRNTEFLSWDFKLRWLKWNILTLEFNRSPYLGDNQEDIIDIPDEREEGTAEPITWQDYEQV
jgi:hypothetical protein